MTFRQWALSAGYDENALRGVCTIDRIDGDKGYSPDNCRMATYFEQAWNRKPRQKKPPKEKGPTQREIEDREIDAFLDDWYDGKICHIFW